MTNVYTAEQGCESSRADAKHDFHSIFKADKLEDYVTSNIPKIEGVDCLALTEDKFIDKHLLETASDSGNNKSTPDYVSSKLNATISGRYIAKYIVRPQHKFDAPYNVSLLQEHFRKENILDDIFFVCDVAYANVREDLKFANSELPQTFYWVQNAQTLYDPAGKTSWHSDKSYFDLSEPVISDSLGGGPPLKVNPVEPPSNLVVGSVSTSKSPSSQGKSSSLSRIASPNYFKKDNSKFVFCWQNAGTDKVIPYPIWPGTTTAYSYSFSQEVPEQMLYTNKNLYLGIRSDDVRDYSTHEAYLIITDPTKPRYFGFSDKVLSAKGSGILKGADLASYRAKGESLKKFVKFVDTRINTPDNTRLFLDEVMDYSPELQVLSKKTGDASQSLSCCNKQFNLQRFKYNSVGLAGDIDDFVSNSNHAFVSFDRIAWASALNYNCPIVIANTQEGFTVYIRNDLLDVHKQINGFFSKTDEAYKILAPLKEGTDFILVKQCGLFPKLSNDATTSFRQACSNLKVDINPNDDTTYQKFLIAYFLELNTLNLFFNIDKFVLHFVPEIYNDKIKQLYKTNMGLLQMIFPLDTTTLDSLESITDLANIIRMVSENVSKIIVQLKTAYDGVEPGVKAVPIPTDEKKEYTKILTALKYLQAIITGITEIQKQLALNITSMKALTSYQTEIGELTPKSVKEGLDLLPKGVASNIQTCTPYKYCIVNSKPIRTTDILFERSTSIFGTTTVILQIFNTLNNSSFSKFRDVFMNKLYTLLDELIKTAQTTKNTSFEAIVDAAKIYMANNLIGPADGVMSIDDIISELLLAPPPPPPPPTAATTTAATTAATSAATSAAATSAAAVEEEIPGVDLKRMREIFKQKNLLIPEGVTSDVNFLDKINEIRDATNAIDATVLALLNGEEVDPGFVGTIKNAYETDTFVKGFIGILIFMAYTKYQEDYKVPVILSRRAGATQDDMIKRLFSLMYQDLDSTPADDSDAKICLDEIRVMVPGFVLADYDGASDKQKYIFDKVKMTTRGKKLLIASNIVPKIEEVIKYYNSNKNVAPKLTQQEDPVFIVDSFRKILAMNVVSFGNKPLEGDFKGINGSEINVNMALLYFIENKIAFMNETPLPHPEFVGLFSQLFKEKGFLSAESTTTAAKFPGKGGGEDDDIFSVMQNLFVSDTPESKALFNKYRRNSYLLLNMPTTYEIVTNSFGSYPIEIRLYLQNLNKQYIQEQAGKESQQKFTEVFGSKKGAITGQPPASYDMGRGVEAKTVAVEVGGKTRKNKRKIMPKRKSRRDKKSRRGRNKTKKIKRGHKRNKHSRRFKTQ
jgi:hypothetical protein